MSTELPGFAITFRALTGHEPFPWQSRLFERFVANEVPGRVDLPTGTGKTAIMAIWLCAVAEQATLSSGLQLPRRLVWVVDRRVVVDQATDEAGMLAKRLVEAEPAAAEENRHALSAVRTTLGAISLTGATSPLGVSTLRGELADNGEWRRDPSRPAIIVGTVDMVGSRLLFSGYGDGRWKRPFHAGLLGQDALIVNDEAHLTPAFASLLEDIKRLQSGSNPSRKSYSVLHVSASLRNPGEEAFQLDDSDKSSTVLNARLHATKGIETHRTPSRLELESRIVELALSFEDGAVRVLVYLNSVEGLRRVAARLQEKAQGRVTLLTGTLRGYERDRLVSDPRFQRFLMDHPVATAERTWYLLSTSAGEVGVNLDADHLVCDLTTADRMVQRLGRVNRSGGDGREAHIHVVVNEEDLEDLSLNLTLAYLENLPLLSPGVRDGSPQALAKKPPAAEAFSEVPSRAILTTPWLDALSLTSPSVTKRRAIEILPQLLRGVQAEEPDCYVAWRWDVYLLASERVALRDCERVLDIYDIQTREMLRERRSQVVKALGVLAKRSPQAGIIVRGSDGEIVYRGPLADFSDRLEQSLRRGILDFATLLLPTEIGGLDDGLLSPNSRGHVEDVADFDTGSDTRPRARYLFTRMGERWEVIGIGGEEVTTAPMQTPLAEMVRNVETSDGVRCVYCAPVDSPDQDDDAPTKWLAYFMDTNRAVDTNAEEAVARGPQSLERHLDRVASMGRELGLKLALPASLVDALVQAGAWHDLGKRREIWQAAVGNSDLEHPLAKSGQGSFNWARLRGYRHEMGSILDVGADAGGGRVDDVTDLALHLVASHHGFARPNFSPKAFDKENPLSQNTAINEEVARRFARLQGRFGWWGLAYLEAAFKAADALASLEVFRQ